MLESLGAAGSLGWGVAVFLLAAAVTVLGSVRMAALGDVLADRTGWGEAVFGAVFFGLATSLSGIVMTAVSAASDEPGLAYGNAVGGIAAQTLALAAADFFYRRANLEHAAASAANLLFGCLLIGLLALALLAAFGPDVTLLGVHPASAAMVAFYLGGLRLIRDKSELPMWRAVETAETVVDTPDEASGGPDGDRGGAAAGDRVAQHRTGALWARFAAIGLFVAAGGWAVAEAAAAIMAATGLSAGFVGAVLMGLVNALPETVTAIAAVRRGAMTLAVAAVIGGNSLDVLNLVVGDVFYRAGSLFHAPGPDELFLTAGALLMTTILLGGLLIRQTRGWGRIGFEGVLLIAVYLGIVSVLAF
ncbi:sodium:calcium antiporter [Allonocardiopsis opalescens]|uniref:Cation:H+ antiporter n=1 Tax=Allonocardiopsis opalescens TaxID=1144618 RepID=A0A2T0QES2_9ACTN|nr:cation transporter [Allonocardiopsis opalescens]PRY02351.1 cation:H+ antiporter [Allonocardiopsis opalescens]